MVLVRLIMWLMFISFSRCWGGLVFYSCRLFILISIFLLVLMSVVSLLGW